jgi:hypothetical protein
VRLKNLTKLKIGDELMRRFNHKHYNPYLKQKDDNITKYFNSKKVPYKVDDIIVISTTENGIFNYCKRIDYQVYQSGELADYIYKEME